MREKIYLKDLLFNKTKIEQIAEEIYRVYPAFKKRDFTRGIIAKFPVLELKARISWIAEQLKTFLPGEYTRAVSILLRSLPAPNNPDLSDDDFGDFIYAPYSEYVAKYGCTKKHLQCSLDALYEITQRFSAEDSIRYFINAFPRETLTILQSWTKDPHYHVRRLCSEGTRPKLPWSQKINIPVTAPLPILDNLFSDKTRYVTRSVANHLNDISKINPNLAIDKLAGWQKSGKQKSEEMEYIVRHSLRSLVKQGHPKAMKLLGFSHTLSVRILKFSVPKHVKMNTVLEFSLTLQSREAANVLIDYILYFQNKAGKMKSRKVFKLTELALTKKKPASISKRHMLRKQMTTRTLYPGKHEIEIQINGNRFAKKSFLLTS